MGKVSQDWISSVCRWIEDRDGGQPSRRRWMCGTSSDFTVDTFGKPKTLALDRATACCASAIDSRGGGHRKRQFEEVSDFTEALKNIRSAGKSTPAAPLALPHRRGVLPPEQLPGAANEFREALNGDLEPK